MTQVTRTAGRLSNSSRRWLALSALAVSCLFFLSWAPLVAAQDGEASIESDGGTAPQDHDALGADLSRSFKEGVRLLRSGQFDDGNALVGETFRQARERFEPGDETLGALARDVVKVASWHYNQGRHGHARPLFEQLHDHFVARGGENSASAQRMKSNLGRVYRSLGDYAKAEEWLEAAMAQSLEHFGADSALYLDARSGLARTLEDAGQYFRAEALFRQELDYYLAEDGPNALTTLTALENVAWAARRSGRQLEALPLFEDLYSRSQEHFGENAALTDRAQLGLGSLYGLLGRYRKAEPYILAVYERRKTVLGPEHFTTLQAGRSLAGLYRSLARYDEAIALYRKSYEVSKQVRGAEHPDTILSLWHIGQAYHDRGRFAEAETIYREVLGLEERMQGRDHPGTIATLRALALLYQDQGRLDEAEALLVESRDLLSARLGPDHVSTLSAQENLARFYADKGRFDEAERVYRRSLQIRRELLGESHPSVFNLRSSLASLDIDRARYAKAAATYEQLLKDREAEFGVDSEAADWSRANLASAYHWLGRYDEAIHLKRAVVASQETKRGPDDPSTLNAIRELALTHLAQGSFEESANLFRQVADVSENLWGRSHPDTLFAYAGLADVYDAQARYGEAEPLRLRHLEGMLAIYGPGHKETLVATANLGVLYRRQGRSDLAEPLYRRALEGFTALLGPAHRETIVLKLNTGRLLEDAERHDEAEAHLSEGFALAMQTLGPDHPDTLGAMANLAAFYRRRDRVEEAGPLTTDLLARRTALFGAQHPETLESKADLGRVMLATGKADRAEPLFWQSLAGRTEVLPAHHPEIAASWQDLGRLKRDHADSPRQATFFYKKAVNTLQGVRQNMTNLSSETRQAFVEKWSDTYTDLQKLLIDQGRFPEAEQVGRMLKEVEYTAFVRGATGQASADALSLTTRESEWDAQLAGWLETPTRLAREYSALRTRQRQGDDLSDLEQRQLAELKEAHGAAYEAFAARVADWDKTVRAIKNETVQDEARELAVAQSNRMQKLVRGIGEDAAILQAVAFDDALHLFLITPDAFVHEQVEVSRNALSLEIFDALAMIKAGADPAIASDPGEQAAMLDSLAQLHDWLIAPIADELEAAGTRTVMLNLQGQLRFLPYAALWDGEGWLAERYQFAFYTPAAQTRYDRFEGALSGQGFGVSKAVEGFDALPGVPEELKRIIGTSDGGVMPGQYKLDEAFTREAFEETLEAPAPILHVATHFEIRPGDWSESRLLLGAGTLSIADMNRSLGFQFDGVELLTLSACETAVGAEATGMEIEGFGALAQNKGAASVLASLWKVSDNATPELMDRFYSALIEDGLSKAGAMQSAQLAFIRSDEFDHPYYWAPFILMGNWK